MLTESTNMINNVASLIQLSVAPVFLLAGVAGLLNVFTGRLTRVADQVYKLDAYEKNNEVTSVEITRRLFLTRRMKNINYAILLATVTGLLVALVIVTMFASSLLEFQSAMLISIIFILAMLSLIISLLLFLKEIHNTSKFIRSVR